MQITNVSIPVSQARAHQRSTSLGTPLLPPRAAMPYYYPYSYGAYSYGAYPYSYASYGYGYPYSYGYGRYY